MTQNTKGSKNSESAGKRLYASIMKKLSYRFGIKIAYVMVNENNYHAKGATCFDSGGYQFKALTNDELLIACKNKDLDLTLKFVEQSIKRGDKCLGVLCNDEVVGYTWRTLEAVSIDDDLEVSFAENAFYNYKSFILPQHRGKRLLNSLNQLTIESYFNQGRTYTISCIETHNFASLRSYIREGFKPAGYLLHIKNRFGFLSIQSYGAKKHSVNVHRKTIPIS